MANGVFNVAKGKAAEKIADAATNVGILILKTAEADSSLQDRTTVADILAGNTEATNTGYARKTGLTGTVTVDQANDRVDLDLPDQTWTAVAAAGGAWVKLIVFYEESAADSGRIPLTHHDFAVTPDGTDITATITNFFRAS